MSMHYNNAFQHKMCQNVKITFPGIIDNSSDISSNTSSDTFEVLPLIYASPFHTKIIQKRAGILS